jgi:hypothetical protein
MSVAGGGVFVSYRREDGGDAAGRLADHLIDRFGADRVFIDVDAIEPGMDYVEAITDAVEACDVLVAVIGPRWLSLEDSQGRRLDDPYDWVRVEVRTALTRGVRVIPVLLGSAVMPTRADLPEDLAGLVRRSALRIRPESFRTDAAHLLAVIGQILDSHLATGAPDRITALVQERLLEQPQPGDLTVVSRAQPGDRAITQARAVHPLEEGEAIIAVWEFEHPTFFRSKASSAVFTSRGIHFFSRKPDIFSSERRLFIPYRELHRYEIVSRQYEKRVGTTANASSSFTVYGLLISGPGKFMCAADDTSEDINRMVGNLEYIKQISAA